MSSQEPYEEYEEPRGLWSKVRRLWGTEEVVEEEAEPAPNGAARRRSGLRLDSARGVHVAVRRSATAFNDAKAAADGLKAGQQQIVNLEQAQSPMSERILDFLSGVTYALDGTVERISDRVYLFAPANVDVEVDGGSETGLT